MHITEKGNKEIESCKDGIKMFTTRLFDGINKEDLDRMKTYCQIFEKEYSFNEGGVRCSRLKDI